MTTSVSFIDINSHIAPVKTLLDLRGAVQTKGKNDFTLERAKAKAAVAKRVAEEMK